MSKRCFVPSCANTSQNCPTKLFITIPKTASRKLWFKAVNLRPVSTPLYCCEDHFNLVEDSTNYQYNKIMMGSRVIMKNDVVPHLNVRSPISRKVELKLSVRSKKRKLKRTIAEPDTATRDFLFVDSEGAQATDSNSNSTRVPVSHLDVQLSNLKNDASNLDYYLTKRMKKLLFKPHALPKPVSIVTIEPPALIKQEPADCDADDTIHIKEEPADLDEYDIKNEPIDIKIESRDELCSPSPPPLVPAVQLSVNEQQQQQQHQQPIVINSFQVANHQLRSQLLRLATQGRLRVVNVNSPTGATSTPTLAVLGTDGMTVNTATGVIQTAALTRHGPPQLLQRPIQVQMSANQLQRVRMINVQQSQVAGGVAKPLIGAQKVVNIRPMSVSVRNRQQLLQSSALQQIAANNSSILRHQLVLPKPPVKLSAPNTQAPSLIPLPMRSVFACGKCTELFYTTQDRDRHIENKHPGSLYSPVAHYVTAKYPIEMGGTDGGMVVSGGGKRKMDKEAQMDFTCEFCLVNLPSSQKVEHLATHETFKCVICHQTLEKRIYAAHMMSHIEDRPATSASPPSSKSRRKSSDSPNQSATIQKSRFNVAHKKKSPPKISATQSGSKLLDNRHDLTILEVKKAANNHPDVEENLDEYMIPKEMVNKHLNDALKKLNSSSQETYRLQTCAQCKKNFCTLALLLAHQEREHKPVRNMHLEKMYSCPRCPISFAHKISCGNHIRKTHSHDTDNINLQPQSKYKRQLSKVKDVSRSNIPVKNEMRSDVQVIQDDDMDYDEDYPLSLLLQRNGENNNFVQELQGDEVEISCFPEDEGDDRPEYVDITQYNVMD